MLKLTDRNGSYFQYLFTNYRAVLFPCLPRQSGNMIKRPINKDKYIILSSKTTEQQIWCMCVVRTTLGFVFSLHSVFPSTLSRMFKLPLNLIHTQRLKQCGICTCYIYLQHSEFLYLILSLFACLSKRWGTRLKRALRIILDCQASL